MINNFIGHIFYLLLQNTIYGSNKTSSSDRRHLNQSKTFGTLDGLKQFEFQLLTSGVAGQIKDIEAVENEKDMMKAFLILAF